jgi:uncharacterized protein YabE (DUF348 family)
MKVIHLRILGVALILAGLVLLGYSTRKTVILQVNDNSHSLTTSALTVAGLLQDENLPVRPEDHLAPAAGHWLQNGEAVRLEQAGQVSVEADGRTQILLNLERLPANLLAFAGVRLYPGDLVLVDGQPYAPDKPLPPGQSHSLQVRRAREIALKLGSKTLHFEAQAATLGEALTQAGIQLHTADKLSPPASTPLAASPASEPLQAVLIPSQKLAVHVQEQEISFRSAASSVGEALAEAGLSLQGLDYSEPPAESALPADGQIRVVRVQEKVSIEQEPLAFETKLEPAPDLELDTRKVLQAGEYGLTARRVRVRYEDGQEVSRQVEAEWVAQQPKTRILGYGTKIVVRTLNTPDGPIQYWRAVQMYATSYSPCRIYKDHCDSYTALGKTLQKGIVAMTNYWCRYTCGDQVYVPGYGVGTVADTGGGIPGRYWIDLGYSDNDYVSWHQNVTVYFLAPVPANYMLTLP